MKQEKSCGAVVFVRAQEDRLYLVEHMVQGHYSMCKGHVEGAETETETTLREIKEETGLSVRLFDGFRKPISYSPYPDIWKEVVFFVAEADATVTTAQPEEVTEILWLPYETAMRTFTYDTDKEILEKAHRWLNELPDRKQKEII